MNWSAEMASHEMWARLDTTRTNGEVRLYFKECLQAAFDAGARQSNGESGEIKPSTWLPSAS